MMPRLKVRALIAKDGSVHSSRRTVAEVAQIFEGVNEIWRQAGVQFDVTVTEWRFDRGALDETVRDASERKGDTAGLRDVTGEPPRQITAVYVRSIGGSSGKVFRPKKAILVVDDTKVSAMRTTAHELGHLFDLEHWLDRPPPDPPDRPPDQLMARTQPGTGLTPGDIERVKARLPTLGLDVMG